MLVVSEWLRNVIFEDLNKTQTSDEMRLNNHVLLLELPGLENTNTLASVGNTPGSVSFSHFSWTGIGADKFWGDNEVN